MEKRFYFITSFIKRFIGLHKEPCGTPFLSFTFEVKLILNSNLRFVNVLELSSNLIRNLYFNEGFITLSKYQLRCVTFTSEASSSEGQADRTNSWVGSCLGRVHREASGQTWSSAVVLHLLEGMRKKMLHLSCRESSMMICLQVLPSYLLAGQGMVTAGMLLDRVQVCATFPPFLLSFNLNCLSCISRYT